MRFITLLLVSAVFLPAQTRPKGAWLAGDIHQHTFFTDGSHEPRAVLSAGWKYGLHFQANSEHGGGFATDGDARFWDDPNNYPTSPIRGDAGTRVVNGVNHMVMWRWQSLKEYMFPILAELRKHHGDRTLMTGLEWNMPGHEHCTTGIMTNDAGAIAQFEYLFDSGDRDFNGGLAEGWTGKITTNDHAKAVAGARWMQQNYAGRAYMIPAHPERASSYTVADMRDLHNAGPDIFLGIEGMPGHQKSTDRGELSARSNGGGSYGGAGIFIAKVGGLWDAMLGEGRRFWNFASSDFHGTANDFWPGEYTKMWVFVPDANGDGIYSPEEVVSGLRSGNSFSVHGDLIDGLEFTVAGAGMGEQAVVPRNSRVEVKIRFHSPDRNANGDQPELDHIDLIAGDVTGMVPPDNPAYKSDVNPTTRVLARFSATEWQKDAEGWVTLTYVVNSLKRDMYFRLRGTNLAPNTPYETDALGNPLPDELVTQNLKIDKEAEAWRDLWFYSNPVFVKAQ